MKKMRDLHLVRHGELRSIRVQAAALIQQVKRNIRRVHNKHRLSQRMQKYHIAYSHTPSAPSILPYYREKQRSTYHTDAPTPGTPSTQPPSAHQAHSQSAGEASDQEATLGTSWIASWSRRRRRGGRTVLLRAALGFAGCRR